MPSESTKIAVPMDSIIRSTKLLANFAKMIEKIEGNLNDDLDSASEEEVRALVNGLAEFIEGTILIVYPQRPMIATDLARLLRFIETIQERKKD